jgi:probable phosphoglycerate mutase
MVIVMKIYITRHGETEWNKEGRMQGWENSKLTQKGIDNARKLGKNLKNIDFSCIYCSPLGRTVETAEQIRGSRDIDIICDDSLKEINFGIWGGMMHSEIAEIFPEQHENFWHKPHLYEPIQGEGFPEFIDRVKSGFLNIIANASGENILIVTHAGVKKAISLILKNLSIENFWDPPFMYDTCLTVIEKDGNDMRFILEGDTSHLEQE